MIPVGDPLLEIGDPRSLEIVADLLSTDAVRVARDAPVIIDQWGGPQPLSGRVRRVEPSGFMKVSALGVEEQRVNVIVDFADEVEPPSLGDAYRVEVRIITWSENSVLKVPVGALFRRGQDWGGVPRRQRPGARAEGPDRSAQRPRRSGHGGIERGADGHSASARHARGQRTRPRALTSRSARLNPLAEGRIITAA